MGGGKKSVQAPPAPTTAQIAEQTMSAREAQDPRAAQLDLDILKGPAGVLPTTQTFLEARESLFPEETNLKQVLGKLILQGLESPTGRTPEQQAAVDAIRGRETGRLQEALRTRANLGGGLYGGRAAGTEERAVSELGQAFSAEDIDRLEQSDLRNKMISMQYLQSFFPELGLIAPQYTSPVATPESALSAGVQTRNQDIQLQQQEIARKAALQSALFGALGTAAGGALGGPLGASLGSSLSFFGKPAGTKTNTGPISFLPSR